MRSPYILWLAPALLVAACASQPAPPAAALPKPEAAAASCLRQTGTRLALPEGRCVAASGRVLTPEDLERAGTIDTGEALRRLVPF